MTDVLDQLRAADPVDRTTLDVPERLRARVLDRREPPRRRRVALRPAGLALAVAGAAAAIVLLAGGGADGGGGLAARAYAATTGPGVIHWRTEILGSSGGVVGSHQRTEGWARDGVVHELWYDVVHGKAILQGESRYAAGRTTIWSRGTDDYSRFRGRRRTGSDPLQGGDPFAVFRKAYRIGKLTKIGPARFHVDRPGSSDDHADPALAYYDVDPRTALPTRFVQTTPAHSARIGGRTRHWPTSNMTMTFAVYERLPFDAATREKLRLRPHPGAGAPVDAAASFAVLRTGPRPDPAGTRAVLRMVHGPVEAQLDAASARVLAPRTYLVAGPSKLCVVVRARRGSGSGGSCVATHVAIEHGLGITFDGPGLLVVPDGVRAVTARMRGRRQATVPARGNLARLPADTFTWRFVR